MAIVGETFVAVRVVSENLERDITAQVTAAAKRANEIAKFSPSLDTKALDNELKNLEAKVASARTRLEETGSSGGKAGGVFEYLRSRLQSVAQSGGPVSSELAKISQAALAVAPEIAVATVAIGAIGAISFIAAEKFVELTDQVRRFQQLTGASAEDASKFVVALRLMGVEPERVAAGLFRLGHQISDGKETLSKYGVEVAKTVGGNTDMIGTFLNIADAVQKASGDGDKAAIAFAAFGRQGSVLLPILNQGRDGLKALFDEAAKHNELFSQAQVDQGLQTKIAINNVKEAFTGLEGQLGRSVAPVLVVALKALSAVLDEIGRQANSVIGVIELLTGVHFGAASAAEVQAASIKDLVGKTVDLQTSIVGLLEAQKNDENAKLGETTAANTLTSATDNLTRIQVDHARAIVSANESLANANYSLAEANKAALKAQQDLTDAQESAARDSERLSLRVQDTANAQARAQEVVTRGHFHGRDAALDRSDAEDKLTQATLDHEDAVAAFNKAQAEGIDGSLALASATDNAARAQHAVETTTAAAGKAQQQVNDLARGGIGDAAYQDQLAGAQQGVALAVQGIANSHIALYKADVLLGPAQDKAATAIKAMGTNTSELTVLLKDLVDTYHIDVAPILKDLGGLGAPFTGGGGGQFGGHGASGSYAPKTKLSQTDKQTLLASFLEGLAGLAGGGHANAGEWYQVNENGPEFFRPDSSGTVLPVGSAEANGASGGIHQQFNIVESSSPSHTAQLVSIHTGRALRTASR